MPVSPMTMAPGRSSRRDFSKLVSELFVPARLNAPVSPNETLRIERVVAIARLFIAGLTVAAVIFTPPKPTGAAPHYELTITVLLALYVAHSITALVVLRRRGRVTHAYVLTAHAVDLVFATTVTLATSGPSSPLFALFIFILLAAAFRWGFWETLITALGATAVLLIEAALLSRAQAIAGEIVPPFTFGDLVARTGYLTVMGLLLGYLSEETKQLRSETAAIADLLSRVRIDEGLTQVMSHIGVRVRYIFRASQILIVMDDLANGRVFRWDSNAGWAKDTGGVKAERAVYWFGPRDDSSMAVRPPLRKKGRYRFISFDAQGREVASDQWVIPPEFTSSYPCRRFICVPFAFGAEWSTRLYVIDPSVDVAPEPLVRFAQSLAQQVGPAIFNVYLISRLRERAGAIERARVARELHDGIIQTMLATELELEAMRRRGDMASHPISPDLERIQSNVHNEVVSLRELMHSMRPLDVSPHELPAYLADIVQRFGRNSGISARFATDLDDVPLPARACHELVRIVQEGLVNVRKHGGAHNVMVRLTARDGQIHVEIDDDGKGFPFAGRLTQAQLDERRIGPVVIKERVRTIGGELTIDSTPGRGAVLHVSVPQEARG